MCNWVGSLCGSLPRAGAEGGNLSVRCSMQSASSGLAKDLMLPSFVFRRSFISDLQKKNLLMSRSWTWAISLWIFLGRNKIVCH